jgi:putative nucleotidyltransferase with HDIG domain
VLLINSFNENKAVSLLAEAVALNHGMMPIAARQVKTAAALHDIGKLKIPKHILDKPGALEPHEFEIIKTHTVLGAEMLRSIQGEMGEIARAVCRYHHEWYDAAKSYWGLRAADLPIYIPIVSVCDVFTALVSRRQYKEPWPPGEALEYIKNHSGTQFDPTLVAEFIPLILDDDRVPDIFNWKGR